MGEVTFLPKEAPWEGAHWWLWCTPTPICLHGAGASGGKCSTTSSPPGSFPPSDPHGSYLHPGPEAAAPGSCISRSVWVSAFCSCRVRVWVP